MITLYGHQLNALFKIIDMHWHAIEYIGCMSIEHMHILWNSTDMHCSDLKFKCNASKTMDMQGARVDMRFCIAINCQWHAGRDMQRRAIQVIDMQLQVIDMKLACIDMHWNSIEIHWVHMQFIDMFLLFIDMQFKWVWLHCNASKLWLASIEIQVIGI